MLIKNKEQRPSIGIEAACDERRYEITPADLPLSCPPSTKRVWDGHPRVYLPIDETGMSLCPYCGTTYLLKGGLPLEKPQNTT